jgi:Ca2+/Na+ antiporter
MQTESLTSHRIDGSRDIDQAFVRPPGTTINKCIPKGIARPVVEGLILIVGAWLLAAAFIMRDIEVSLLFISILFIIYVIVVMFIYYKVCRAKEPEAQKRSHRSNAALWTRIDKSEQGVRLTMYKRPVGCH